MLQRRIVSALVLIAIAIASIGLDVTWPIGENSGAWMTPLFLFATLGTTWEMCELLKRRWSISSRSVIGYAALGLAISLMPTWYAVVHRVPYPANPPIERSAWIVLGVLGAVTWSGIDAMRLFAKLQNTNFNSRNEIHVIDFSETQTRVVLHWMLGVGVVTYVVGLMSVWYLIRAAAGCVQGMGLLISILAIIKCSDAGAYFAGKGFGRTKLIVSISPGKTLEGLVGGMIVGMVVSYVAFRVVLPWLGGTTGPYVWGPALFGIALTLGGLVGDLLESMVKRSVGAKDSGSMLPGLGGIWDVTDSLLPTSIVGYLGVMAQLS